jgi:hypothetical protein
MTLLLQQFEVPKDAELSQAFSHVFYEWTQENLQYYGPARAWDQDLSLEWSVPLPGQVTGLLTIRSDVGFGGELTRLLVGEVASLDLIQDAFKEMVNQFTSYLVTDVLKSEKGHFDPFMPVPTSPTHWPHRKPESGCTLNYHGHLLEIRLWMDAQK